MKERIASLKDRLQHAMDIREKKAVDLVNDLKIPKSAVSQYLSGKSQKMDSDRLEDVCIYLDVSEPWLLGYDVPMERKNNDTNNDIVESDEISANRKALIDFAKAVPEDKAELVLRVMKSIVEGGK